MSVFDHLNYKDYLREKISSYPKKGRGVARKLSEHLAVPPTMVSQVLNGDKHFSFEHAQKACDYFLLSRLETRHFLNLLSFEKAGTADLKDFYLQILNEEKEEARKVGKRLDLKESLTESEAAVYYSHWKFSAIRLLTSLNTIKTKEDISSALGLPQREVSQIVDRLVNYGLCVEEDGELRMGEKITYLSPESPFFPQHHRNWRLRAIEECGLKQQEGFYFTAPLTCSQETFEKIQSQVLQMIQEVKQEVSESESEELACFNLDLFRLKCS